MMVSKSLLPATLLASVAVCAVVTIPDVLYLGPTTAEAESIPGGIDSPRLSTGAANATSYDWWYFDAVSASDDSSVVIVFYNSGPAGFINSYEGGPLSVSISGSFANGTLYAATTLATGGAIIDTCPGFINGTWVGSGFSFVGTAVGYEITIDAPEVGISGTIVFKSLAPPHYPCGLDVAGSDEQIVPHVFWANAVPDASVVVDLTVGAVPVAFDDGVGYHDKNWGDATFATQVSTWYWGHAHFGPYSVVFFDATDSSGVESFSGFVAKDGVVLESSCALQAALVRPWGVNSAYPPIIGTLPAQGVVATFELGYGKTLVANITTGLPVITAGVYNRMLGSVEGGVVGEEQFTGRVLFEDFQFTPL